MNLPTRCAAWSSAGQNFSNHKQITFQGVTASHFSWIDSQVNRAYARNRSDSWVSSLNCFVMNTHEIEVEVSRLAERIEELKTLQVGQKHLPFIVSHLEDHIQTLQRRIEELQKLFGSGQPS